MSDLTDYPRTPGWQPPQTSIDSAESVAEDIGRLQAQVLDAIRAAGSACPGQRSGGLTADEAAQSLGLTPFTCRPRVTELSKLGLVRDSGERRANPSGRKAIVWVAVPQAELARTQAEAEATSRLVHTSNEAERTVRRIIKEDR